MKLTDYQIVNQWHALLPRCHGEAPGILAMVEDELAQVGVPGLYWSQESVSTGLLKGLFGKRRDFLLVSHEAFSEYRVLVGCQNYGTALGVSRLVVASARLLNDAYRAIRLNVEITERFQIGSELDPFDLADLRAILEIIHQAVRGAVQNLLSEREEQASSSSQLAFFADEDASP